jgi:hypothetical protein
VIFETKPDLYISKIADLEAIIQLVRAAGDASTN